MTDPKHTLVDSERLNAMLDCPAGTTLVAAAADELERLRAELAAINEAHYAIINEPCNEAEKHCSCVSTLRDELDRLRAENAELRPSASAWSHLMTACEAIQAAGVNGDVPKNQHLDAYIEAWSKQTAELAKLRAENAELRAACKLMGSTLHDCVRLRGDDEQGS